MAITVVGSGAAAALDAERYLSALTAGDLAGVPDAVRLDLSEVLPGVL